MKNVLLLSRNRLSLSARIAQTNSNSYRMLTNSLSKHYTLVYSCCRLFWFCYPDSISLVESDEDPMQR